MPLIEDAQNQLDTAKRALEPVTASVAAARETVDRLGSGSRAVGYEQKAARAGAIGDALGDLHTALTDSAGSIDDLHRALDALKGLLHGGSLRPPIPPPAPASPNLDLSNPEFGIAS